MKKKIKRLIRREVELVDAIRIHRIVHPELNNYERHLYLKALEDEDGEYHIASTPEELQECLNNSKTKREDARKLGNVVLKLLENFEPTTPKLDENKGKQSSN